MPTERLNQLAAILEETARLERENAAAMMAVSPDPRIGVMAERLAQQMEITAQRIRIGEFDE